MKHQQSPAYLETFKTPVDPHFCQKDTSFIGENQELWKCVSIATALGYVKRVQ